MIETTKYWEISYRTDPRARKQADQHYSRQSVGAKNFVKPGSCLVLVLPGDTAYWVTSNCIAEYVKHDWAGAWECSAFRNDGSGLIGSDLILDAISATLWKYGTPPSLGMITMVDPSKVAGTFMRIDGVKTLVWGYCFIKAGFEYAGWTKSGKYVLRLRPEKMPEPKQPRNSQTILCSL